MRIARLPRVGPSYAELTIPRRHTDTAQDGERADLLLAEWFAGGEPSPGADEIWDRLGRGRTCPRFPSGHGPLRPN